jgi:hypothetical protein
LRTRWKTFCIPNLRPQPKSNPDKHQGMIQSGPNRGRGRPGTASTTHFHVSVLIAPQPADRARRMGGASRYPSIAVCEDDGLSEGLTHPTAYQLRSRDLVDRHLVRDAAQRHRLSVGFSPLVSSSKRSPDEPTGRANARPMTGSGISGFIMLSPACRCAHAGYLLEWNKNPSSKLEVEKPGGSHGSDNALPEMRKTNGPGCHPLRTHRPPMHQL